MVSVAIWSISSTLNGTCGAWPAIALLILHWETGVAQSGRKWVGLSKENVVLFVAGFVSFSTGYGSPPPISGQRCTSSVCRVWPELYFSQPQQNKIIKGMSRQTRRDVQCLFNSLYLTPILVWWSRKTGTPVQGSSDRRPRIREDKHHQEICPPILLPP